MNHKTLPPFEHKMSRVQQVLGWLYIPVHAAALPMLLSAYALSSPETMSEAQINVLYYAVSAVFVLVFMGSYLRREFDTLCDGFRGCLLTLLLAYCLNYALSFAASLLLALIDGLVENPNDAAIMEIAKTDYGLMKGVAIFMAPIVEEVLFRGVAFGSLRRRSRRWAYAVSMALFAFYHVWQYAVTYGDAAMLLYALQYIPVSFVLAWCYERSGSIWTPIFFHMGFNAASFYALQTLESMM